MEGDLPPGARLNQAELAGQLSVSRIPVRDALHQLAAEGLVQLNRRSSATVTGLTIADLQELYELREAIEPLATRLGMPNVGRAHLLQMRQWAETMEATTDPAVWLRANTEFHALIYRQAIRPRMIDLVENLRQQVERYTRLYLTIAEAQRHLAAEHRGILEAAQRGDPREVEELTRRHLVTSHQVVLAHLLELERGQDADRGALIMPEVGERRLAP